VLTYCRPNIEQLDHLFNLMCDETSEYLKDSLWLIGLTTSAFRAKFKSVGEVVEIFADGEPAGFYWIEKRGDILHLHGIILRREFQGRGLGHEAMQRIEDEHGLRIAAIELGVYRDNTAARRLYERLGYVVFKRRDDVHFDIMRKTLAHDGAETASSPRPKRRDGG
jgi:ribosomal protein S18 acetylase RimI-like enzyme